MRRTILFAAVVALALIVAIPAAALPKKAFSFDTVCDLNGDGSLDGEVHFVTVGNHFAGWAVPWSPVDGLSGGVLVGGTQSYTQDGQPVGEPYTWYYPLSSMAPQRRLLSELLEARGSRADAEHWRDSFRNSWAIGDLLFVARPQPAPPIGR